MYEKGGHGFGMRKQIFQQITWIERFYDWLKTMNLVTPPTASANPFQRTPTPNDTLKPVRILADNKVVLSIYAPEAKEVTVMGDYAKVYGADKLTKADNGVWSVTVGPLVPDVYTYDFTVDGVRTFDPKNPQYKEGQNNLSNVFELPGKENDFQSIKNVPHGKVETVWFASAVMNNTGRMHVYTPRVMKR
jgi:enterochelin esterase family protein